MLYSIVGWDSVVGEWSRVEGHPADPDPNDPYGVFVCAHVGGWVSVFVLCVHLLCFLCICVHACSKRYAYVHLLYAMNYDCVCSILCCRQLTSTVDHCSTKMDNLILVLPY